MKLPFITFDTTSLKPPVTQVLLDLHTVLSLQADLEALLEEGGWLESSSFGVPMISHGKVSNHGSFILDEEEVNVFITKHEITVSGIHLSRTKVELAEAACFLDQSIKIARLYEDASAYAKYIDSKDDPENVSQAWIDEQIKAQNIEQICPKGHVELSGSFSAVGKVTVEGKELDVCQVNSLQLTLGGSFNPAQESLHTGDVPAFIMRGHNRFRSESQGECLIRLPQGTVFALLGTDFEEGLTKDFGTHNILLIGSSFEATQARLGQLEGRVRSDWNRYEDVIKTSNFKWNWCMEYCRDNGLAPAQSTHWDESEQAYRRLQGRLDSFRDLYDDGDICPNVLRSASFHALPE